MILSPALAGFCLDCLFGDPAWDWHPVRLMGKAVAWADARLPHTKLAGTCLASALPLGLFFGTRGLLHGLGRGAWIINALLIFSCIAAKDMVKHAKAVLDALEAGDLALARIRVAMIVGRDTANLDEAGVLRACVESVAESFCDGVLAPLFFAFWGGAPLALAHKAVSTLDSMIGYKNDAYRDFGWASAKLDDVLNYIPARLSALLVALVSSRPKAAMAAALKDASKQPSPNSGWPEAAFAGALGLQLGGPSSYQGRLSDKALLGLPLRGLNTGVARESLALFWRASFLAAVLGELAWHFPRA